MSLPFAINIASPSLTVSTNGDFPSSNIWPHMLTSELMQDVDDSICTARAKLAELEIACPPIDLFGDLPIEAHHLVKGYCNEIARRIRKRDGQGKLIPFVRVYELADVSFIVETPYRNFKVRKNAITVVKNAPASAPIVLSHQSSEAFENDESDVSWQRRNLTPEDDPLFDSDTLQGFIKNQIEETLIQLKGNRLHSRLQGMIIARLMNTLWGMPANRLVKYAISRIANLLDPKAKELTRLIFGYSFTMSDYNSVCANLTRIEKLTTEARNLAPFIGLYLRFPWADNAPLMRFQAAMPRSALDDDNFFALARESLINECGFTHGAWSWLARQNYRSVASTLYYSNYDPSVAGRWVRFSVNSRVNFPETIRKYLLKKCRGWFSRISPRIAQSIEEGALQAKRDRRLKPFVRDLGLVLDCLKGPLRDNPEVVRTGQPHEFPSNQVNSWKKLWKMQEKWHRKVLDETFAEGEASWQCCLAAFSFDGYFIVPLNTALSLYREGQMQHHCVYSYVAQCQSGNSRIFSIRTQKKILATVEICFNDQNMPFVSKCEGPCNDYVSPRIHAVAEEIRRRYRQSLDALTSTTVQ